MKQYLYTDTSAGVRSLGLLVLRVAVGVAFIIHSWSKIKNPTGWMGAEPPFPGILLAVAAYSEFVGGIALILGLLTPIASLALIGTMIGAIQYHTGKEIPDPFVGGYELAVAYLAASICVLLTGPGQYSVDAVLSGKCCKTA